ncbi:MAG: matrixin family metalloprotease [Deltaproteobacteria bacterium]|nr:matrixin family metalloprotease [Deltaproteobacteria bacterium]MCW5803397.1 matrixin family metalloprotease [Deltaproteobacteria bacterium]
MSSTQDRMGWEEFYEMAQGWKDAEGVYIVDWDLAIYDDAGLRKYYDQFQQGALAIYTQNGQDVKWNAQQKKNLTYCIGPTFGVNKPKVIEAMNAATVMGWEKFADVKFVYVPGEDANCNAQNTNVLFDVNQTNSNGQYLARAFFPNDPRNRRNVLVDPGAFDPAKTNNIPVANIIGHELGHVLGFRHEHIRADGQGAAICPEDNAYRSLTTYDSASVMHYPQCNGTSTTLTFTQRDRDGVAAVYGAAAVNPAPMSQLMYPMDGQIVPPDFTIEASVVDTDLAQAELFFDGNSYQTLLSGPFRFEIRNASVGQHTLRIVGTDAAGQTGEQTVTITVQKTAGPGGNPDPSGDNNGDDTSGDYIGGCSTSGGGSAGFGLALGLAALLRRRR